MFGNVAKVLFPLLEILEGTSIQKSLRQLEHSQYLSCEELAMLQWCGKTKKLLVHAYCNVPFYRAVLMNSESTSRRFNRQVIWPQFHI